MEYTRAEIAGARRLKALGLPWRPRVGDWYATDAGFVSFVRGEGDASHAAAHHTWLPDWRDCREWLRDEDITHPEFAIDEQEEVRIEVIGPGGKNFVGLGATDLECLYGIMAQVLAARG
jgi:hypothetical protein